jgi:hypothetical protein
MAAYNAYDGLLPHPAWYHWYSGSELLHSQSGPDRPTKSGPAGTEQLFVDCCTVGIATLAYINFQGHFFHNKWSWYLPRLVL